MLNYLLIGECRNPAVVVDTEWKTVDELREESPAAVFLEAEGQTPVMETGAEFGCVHHEPVAPKTEASSS